VRVQLRQQLHRGGQVVVAVVVELQALDVLRAVGLDRRRHPHRLLLAAGEGGVGEVERLPQPRLLVTKVPFRSTPRSEVHCFIAGTTAASERAVITKSREVGSLSTVWKRSSIGFTAPVRSSAAMEPYSEKSIAYWSSGRSGYFFFSSAIPAAVSRLVAPGNITRSLVPG